MWANGPIRDPYVPLIIQTVGSKSPSLKFQTNGWWYPKCISTAHWLALGHGDTYNFIQIQILKIEDWRLNKIYVVIEQPDHHCGDDLMWYYKRLAYTEWSILPIGQRIDRTARRPLLLFCRLVSTRFSIQCFYTVRYKHCTLYWLCNNYVKLSSSMISILRLNTWINIQQVCAKTDMRRVPTRCFSASLVI